MPTPDTARLKSAHSCRLCGRWLEGEWNRSDDAPERSRLQALMDRGYCDSDECIAMAEVITEDWQRDNMRRRAWMSIGVDELIRMLDLPAGTTVLAVQASIDPPSVRLALHNPAWPVQVPDAESPMLPYEVEIDGGAGTMRRIYGRPPAPVGWVGNDGRGMGKDPTYGRIDPDIQQQVDAMEPSSLGQRVALENTIQNLRDREKPPTETAMVAVWPCPVPDCQAAQMHYHDGDGTVVIADVP